MREKDKHIISRTLICTSTTEVQSPGLSLRDYIYLWWLHFAIICISMTLKKSMTPNFLGCLDCFTVIITSSMISVLPYWTIIFESGLIRRLFCTFRQEDNLFKEFK